jgi:hypothetical protein
MMRMTGCQIRVLHVSQFGIHGQEYYSNGYMNRTSLDA